MFELISKTFLQIKEVVISLTSQTMIPEHFPMGQEFVCNCAFEALLLDWGWDWVLEEVLPLA